ncbi:sulfur globule protein CV3 [Marichromatium purpuratum 984]|uniref:Sulfur globule protein CV3 n=1 Tax=Marichromatium purpuratum 984 TaxID=765910 RepID=W0E166_MARPU|nr:hypothetical protein [Marichromatium purpuratum]AHF02846.1 sulfur globule protein CV3 [Marichromatium purpuratum 984]
MTRMKRLMLAAAVAGVSALGSMSANAFWGWSPFGMFPGGWGGPWGGPWYGGAPYYGYHHPYGYGAYPYHVPHGAWGVPYGWGAPVYGQPYYGYPAANQSTASND